MQNPGLHRSLEWNVSNGKFAVGSGGLVQLYSIAAAKSRYLPNELVLESTKEIFTPPNAVQTIVSTCLEWIPNSHHLLAYGTSTGVVSLFNWTKQEETFLYNPAAINRRMCTGMSCNRISPNLFAAGFEKSRTANEFCAAVWDLETITMAAASASAVENAESEKRLVIFKPSFDEPISSISWLGTDATTLIVGTSLSHIRMYDIRADNTQDVLSIAAHLSTRPRKIKGVRPDPFNEYIVATFSDSPLEPVKIWDLRKLASGKPRLTIYPHDRELSSITPAVGTGVGANSVMAIPTNAVSTVESAAVSMGPSVTSQQLVQTVGLSQNQLTAINNAAGSTVSTTATTAAFNSSVIDIAWSPTRANIIAVSTSALRSIGFYSTLKPASESVSRSPVHFVTLPLLQASDSVKCMSWASPNIHAVGMTSDNGTSYQSTPSNRLLVLTSAGIADVKVIESCGLAVGDDNITTVAAGTQLYSYSPPTCRPKYQPATWHQDLCSVPRTVVPSASLDASMSSSNRHQADDGTSKEGVSYLDRDLLIYLRCKAGYGLDAGKNLQILSDEIDSVNRQTLQCIEEDYPSPYASSSSQIEESKKFLLRLRKKELQELTCVWSWVHRVEALKSLHGSATNGLAEFGLRDSGIRNMLASDTSAAMTSMGSKGNGTAFSYKHTTLGCIVYDRESRGRCKAVCGWAEHMSSYDTGNNDDDDDDYAAEHKLSNLMSRSAIDYNFGYEQFSVENDDKNDEEESLETYSTLDELMMVIEECESTHSFERAIAVTVWHGALALAVSLLQKHHAAIERLLESKKTSTTAAGSSVGSTVKTSVRIAPPLINTRNKLPGPSSIPSPGPGPPLSVSVRPAHSFASLHSGASDGASCSSLRSSLVQSPAIDESRVYRPSLTGPIDGRHGEPIHANTGGDHEYAETLDPEHLYAEISPGYLHVLSLVSMCIAGFNANIAADYDADTMTSNDGGGKATGSSTSYSSSHVMMRNSSSAARGRKQSQGDTKGGKGGDMWVSMTRVLIAQLMNELDSRKPVAYLAAACKFLLLNRDGSTTFPSFKTTYTTADTKAAFLPSSSSSLAPTIGITSTTTAVPTISSSTIAETTVGATAELAVSTAQGEHSAASLYLLHKYSVILQDEALLLEDRVAFACTFVGDNVIFPWLDKLIRDSKIGGGLEGLLVTGFSPEGLGIIQQFVDLSGDIQTGALLVARIVDDNEPISLTGGAKKASSDLRTLSYSSEVIWLNEYRHLLNRWGLYFERAALDVDLGKQRRQTQMNQYISSVQHRGAGTGAGNLTGNAPGLSVVPAPGSNKPPQSKTSSAVIDRKSSHARTVHVLPAYTDFPHVYLRCNYCGSSLPVDPMQQQQQQSAFLRKQKPIMNCCPSCKKPLPRCYVCSLYMGFVNPNIEFNRVLAHKRRVAESTMLQQQQPLVAEDSKRDGSIHNKSHNTSNNAGKSLATATTTTSTTANNNSIATPVSPASHPHTSSSFPEEEEHSTLPLGLWFFFCQRCRHGGHAACINDWFNSTGSNSNISPGVADNLSGSGVGAAASSVGSAATVSVANVSGEDGIASGGGLLVSVSSLGGCIQRLDTLTMHQSHTTSLGRDASNSGWADSAIETEGTGELRNMCGVSGCFCRCNALV